MSMNGKNKVDEELYLQRDIIDEDPEMTTIIKKEKDIQMRTLQLIASENFTSKAVIQAVGSCLTNKFSVGQPRQRSDNDKCIAEVDLEPLCKKRALELFGLDPAVWGVNVQPLSGTPANFAVYTAIVGPHGRIMGLDVPDGGHYSHGFMTPTKVVSAVSQYFETMPYKVNPETGIIDYDELHRTAKLFLPKMIVAGASCYSRDMNFSRFRQIADENGAYLLADIAHVSGLVVAGLVTNPFQCCDVVTTTTHKSLRGPRAGLIFYRKGVRRVTTDNKEELYNLERQINEAVYPGLQGGTHNHQIAGVAVALKQAIKPEFKRYQEQVTVNARVLSRELQIRGFKIVTGGTDTHLILIDLRPFGVDGDRAEKILKEVSIKVNRYICSGDKYELNRSGLRIGSLALTSRNMKEEDFVKVADFIYRGLLIAKLTYERTGYEFDNNVQTNIKQKINELKQQVEEFALQFPIPGLDGW